MAFERPDCPITARGLGEIIAVCGPVQFSVVDTDLKNISLIVFGNAPCVASTVVLIRQLQPDGPAAAAVESCAHKLPDAEHVRRMVASPIGLIPGGR